MYGAHQQLTQATKALDEQSKAANKSLDEQSKAAAKSLDDGKNAAVAALNAPAVDVENRKKVAVSSIEATESAARNNIEKFRNDVEGERNKANASIEKANADFVRDLENGKKRIADEIAALPEEIRSLAASVAAVDHGLQAYHVQIAAIMDRLAAGKGGRLWFVIDVLGWSVWLLVASVAVSVCLPLFVWWRMRRWARQRFQPKV